MTIRIDSHHHLWRFDQLNYDWIDESLSALRRDFQPRDLLDEASTAEVTGTVVVQARQTIAETDELLASAEENSILCGVVGWLPLASPMISRYLAHYRERTYLKGLRHVVQGEQDGFLSSTDFNQGIRAMQGTGLTYDLLIRKEQMEESVAFIDRHPDQTFVLDHMAKPAVGRSDLLQGWAFQMARLAERLNVFCKLSGLVTEAEGFQWSPATVAPYLDVALVCFGPDRLMIGTDWPVLTVGCSYARWWATIEAWSAPLTRSERDAILGATANRVYKLMMEDPGESHESSLAGQRRTR